MIRRFAAAFWTLVAMWSAWAALLTIGTAVKWMFRAPQPWWRWYAWGTVLCWVFAVTYKWLYKETYS